MERCPLKENLDKILGESARMPDCYQIISDRSLDLAL